jgi:hypothetical protein
MEKSLVKLDLISFQKIEKGNFFYAKILVFIKSLLINMEISGLKIIEKERVIARPKDDNFSDFYVAHIDVTGDSLNKRLSIVINNEGLIEFGVFTLDNDRLHQKEIIKSEFMSVYDFSDLFIEIVRNLK